MEIVSALKSPKLRQLIRYGVVGLASNMTGYLIYLLITWLGVDPKVTVTLFYPLAATIAYFGHAKYTFSYKGGHAAGISRYVIAHICGYSLNIGSLYYFVDVLHYPHQLVQFCNIFFVAGFLFIAFKYFSFQTGKPEPQE